ncbi:MBL fold metallo-hydrolase [Paenibacillus sp. LHD-117]|uniref:MBL fold metallo-hydrolase n=1 Tax=Paenibacillus sp. LHD-117 TaxID=3071412 RepID=UPI0027DF9A70|nr:MBL fold metallo-hydrolase [Paenibacillus sp. LHD-117]MDQ6418729.1 MBL fold metallo-hydrolase [Paenibacillus sp. LHD-117]
MNQSDTITELSEGWRRVKVPLPFSLKWVNSYIVPENMGYTIIDPGLRTEEAEKLWDETLQSYGLDWSDIVRIVLTHQHPDHYGLAGYMQERSGAPVYMTERSHRYAERLWGGTDEYAGALSGLFLSNGMPDELMNGIVQNLAGFLPRVSPQPEVTYIKAGSSFPLGGREWLLIDAPGHAFGGLCFYDAAKRWMICGDQVLPRITPNVSVVPGEEEDPLAHFLESLERLSRFEVVLALPGHRDPFADFRERTAELQAFHARRLSDMRDRLAERPMNAFELCESLFGAQLRNNPHNLRFAMAETLAHLFHLELRGLASSRTRSGIKVYQSEQAGER